MAKLEITLDTDSKEMSVSVNGEPIASVRSVDVYSYGDGEGGTEPHFNVCTHEEADGVCRRVCLTADRRADASTGTVVASRFPGLVEVREFASSGVSRAFEELFSRGKRR